MNDLQLMLTGAPAMSWLAGQSYEIGLNESVEKLQAQNDRILKVDTETCLVFGTKLADEILREWDRSPPDGVSLHRLDDAQREKLMNWFGTYT